MDFLQAYFPLAASFYNDYYTPYASYIRPIERYIFLSQSYFWRYLFPYLYPLYNLSYKALTETPSITTLALLAIVLLISLKVLDMMRRTIVYWISMAVSLAKWILVGALGVYVYQRGVEGTVEDLGWVFGLLAGWEQEGEKIGYKKAARRAADAHKVKMQGRRGRTRGAGW